MPERFTNQPGFRNCATPISAKNMSTRTRSAGLIELNTVGLIILQVPHGLAAPLRRPGCVSGRGEPQPLRSISGTLAQCSLVRVVKEELITVGIIDGQEPVTPRPFLDRNALALEFRAKR